MLTLPLDPPDPGANPLFKNAEDCAQWLGQLQLTNLQLAHSQLLTQLNELNRFALPGLERLQTLEQLRETVGYVQDDYAKKLIAKPLPLTEGELMVFVAIVQLWRALVTGYQRCLQDYLASDAGLADQGALLCQRCLLYSGLEIFEHLRTGYEYDPELWRQLHELYAFAEERELHLTEVPDPLNTLQPGGNCGSVYVKTLLACYARPGELGRSQLTLLDRWLTLWNHMVTVERGYTIGETGIKPLVIDLDSTRGLQPLGQQAHAEAQHAGEPAEGQPEGAAPAPSRSNLRYLPMVSLSKLLHVQIIMLQQGQDPQQLNLGDQIERNDCVEFFQFLHQCWCEERNIRAEERHQVDLPAQLCHGLEGIYTHLSGRPFKQPERDGGMDYATSRQIATFGRVLQDAHDKTLLEMGFPLETWKLENVSLLGARLLRDDPLGDRLHTNQLIAVRQSDTNVFMLGTTVWLNVTRTGKLRIGVRFLPGSAEPVSIRATGINVTVSTKYVPAFLLPPMPEFKAPTSLIIPRDWFQPGRVIEVLRQNRDKQNVKLGLSVAHGVDYERVSFTLV